MAVDDSTAPKAIPTTGAIGIGDDAGVDRSINLLKNIKKATGARDSNSSLNDLRNFFKSYVGVTGNFAHTGNTTTEVGLSAFRGAYIYGFRVKVKNETASYYGNSNDGIVEVRGTFGDKASYTVYLSTKGTFVNNYGVTTSYTDLDAGSSYTSYILNVYHGSGATINNNGVSATVYVGYGLTNLPYITYNSISYTNVSDWTDFLMGATQTGFRPYPVTYP